MEPKEDAACLTSIDKVKCYRGFQEVFQHSSPLLGCDMKFAAFLPSSVGQRPLPVVYFLSGLTCSEQNVITKAGMQRHAEDLQLIVVCPDTSPRGEHVADDDAYDLGQGAGFYLDATQPPWDRNFKMRSYLLDELPRIVEQRFDIARHAGIMGHSMGGHGALTLGLSAPERYRSISALAPIVNPSRVPWGQKAFAAYLGNDESKWQAYDACQLVKKQPRPTTPILIDQGTADKFLTEHLQPEAFEQACESVGQPFTLRMQEGYDHSYYFISTFMRDHLEHHARALHAP